MKIIFKIGVGPEQMLDLRVRRNLSFTSCVNVGKSSILQNLAFLICKMGVRIHLISTLGLRDSKIMDMEHFAKLKSTM